ncbi:phage tail tip protein J-related protein, partial [Escherichia coli]|uniref:phage tail tip protein J-related protein n=1 Tax=Escherichia coli TaxID=562 RepID=UPI003FA392DD
MSSGSRKSGLRISGRLKPARVILARRCTVQFEFWFSEKRVADIRQVETSARYLGTALY